jgi:mersacidin/lichenicidin family type 2 lantibiotic
MSRIDIVRAWKDEAYRLSLSEADRASIPAHPAGLIELDDEHLRMVLGGGQNTGIAPSSGCNNRCTCPV